MGGLVLGGEVREAAGYQPKEQRRKEKNREGREATGQKEKRGGYSREAALQRIEQGR